MANVIHSSLSATTLIWPSSEGPANPAPLSHTAEGMQVCTSAVIVRLMMPPGVSQITISACCVNFSPVARKHVFATLCSHSNANFAKCLLLKSVIVPVLEASTRSNGRKTAVLPLSSACR